MKHDICSFSRSLYQFAVISAALACFTQAGHAQNVSAQVSFTNNVGQQIIVGAYGPTGWNLLATVPFSGGCTSDSNNNLIVPKGATCTGVSWPSAQNKICASAQSMTSCTPASLQPMTIIEVSGTGSGLGYDISVIPRNVDSNGVACNDPQWLPNCTYYDYGAVQAGYNVSQLNPVQVSPANQQNKTSSPGYCASQGPANYNFGVQVSCSKGHATFTCGGTPSLGKANYPSNCGYSSLSPTLPNNCIGNLGTGCYQAFFSPMSNGGSNPMGTQTGNGLYYCGYPSGTLQPYDQCASLSDTLTITFSSAQ